MSFTLLSLPWVLGGAAGLAGLLYVLQRLRVRHQRVTVPTTLFWKLAAEEAPARTMTARFRHPLAYLLILLISVLLWLALAGLETRRKDDGAFHVLLLDGSAGMAAGTRWSDAVTALKNQVGNLSPAQRQVLLVGAGVKTLLNPGEPDLLLAKRLEGLAPVAAPAGIEAVLRQIAATTRAGQSTEVLVFGDAPVRPESLAPALKVSRVALAKNKPAANAGITSLGVAEARSGAWDRVDVYLQVSGAHPSAPRIELEGTPLTVTVAPGGDYLLPDLPARGGLLTVKLAADDSLSLDNTAGIRLPDRPKIKVQVSASLLPLLAPVLAADPAIEITEAGANVVIRLEGETFGDGLPALEFVAARDGQSAFLITHPDGLDAAAVLHQAVAAIGLREIDAASLAKSARRPVTASVASGPQWRFSVWRELLSDDFNFTKTRAFPLFIDNAVRWLAGAPGDYPVVAAGRPLESAGLDSAARFVTAQGRALDPLGVTLVPAQAGEFPRAGGAKPLLVSLLDPVASSGATGGLAEAPAAVLAGGMTTNPVTWLLLIALLLLVVEWHFNRVGRIP